MITLPTAIRIAILSSAMGLAGCGSMSSGTMPMGNTTNFGASLTATAEVPTNDSRGGGELTASLNNDTKLLTWRVTYQGLSGPATAGHLHGPAMAGANAGVAVPFTITMSPIEGSATLTASQVFDLRAGLWYANLHTAANPGGEIRGQVLVK